MLTAIIACLTSGTAQGTTTTPAPPSAISRFNQSLALSALPAGFTSGGAVSFDGQKMVMSGGTSGNANTYLKSTLKTALEKYTAEVIYSIASESGGTDYGLGMGFKSINSTYTADLFVQFATQPTLSSQYKNRILIYDKNYAVVSVSPSQLTYTTGDTIKLTVSRVKEVLTVTVTNVTTGASLQHSYTYLFTANPALFSHNLGNPILVNWGGTVNVQSWKYTQDMAAVKTAIAGDSITFGYFAGARASRYADKIGASSYEVFGGPGDKSADLSDRIGEVLLTNPQYVLLAIGVNDALNGVTTSTFSGNLNSIVSQITGAGATPVFTTLVPQNSIDVTPFNTVIQNKATSGGWMCVDIFTALKGTGTGLNLTYDSGDGVHPNSAGHTLMGSTIAAGAGSIV